MPQPKTIEAGERVPFWRRDLAPREIELVTAAMRASRLSQGPVTAELEEKIGAYLGVPHVVMVTSGSTALYAALAVLGIGPGDEVIVPNRTFIATAHAVLLAGASVRLVDTRRDGTVIDEAQIEAAVTPATKAILPVHLNGNAADMEAIATIASRHGLFVIEDAAQALGSRDGSNYLGTTSTLGCFSLGVTKIITAGQGGFVVTRDPDLYERLVLFRNQGVRSILIATYDRFGFNLKFNDVLASIALGQLERLDAYKAAHVRQYREYAQALADLPYIELLKTDVAGGAIPLWIETVCSRRDDVYEHLLERGIQTRPFVPDLSESPHLGNDDRHFVYSKRFRRDGLTLPCGPDLPREDFERTIAALNELRHFPAYAG